MSDEYKESPSAENELPREAATVAACEPGPNAVPPASQPPRRQKKPWTWSRALRLVGIVAGVIFVIVLGVFLVYRSIVKPPTIAQPEPVDPASTQSQPPEDEEFDGVKPYLTGARKQDFYTFLLVGRDVAGGGLTDTIMLASYDVPNQSLSIMSIPRDTMVNATWDVKKINSVYNINGGGEAGVTALKGYVAGLTGFEPDFTVTVEWDAVGELVDAIGGVWFDVPFNMFYSDPYQDLFINQPEGYRLLTGSDAMEVVRWRQNNSGVTSGVSENDITRTQVTQDFIAATVKQCLQIKNVTKVKELARIFTQYVETELTAGELVWFAEQALVGGLSADEMFMTTMPYTHKLVYSRTQGAKLSYVAPQSEELIEIVNQHFNPYLEDVTMAHLDHMSFNSDGSVSSSTGTVRDSQATYPDSYWAPEPEPEPEPTEEPPQETEPGDDPSGETAAPSEDPGQTDTPTPEQPADGETPPSEETTDQPLPSTGVTEPVLPETAPPDASQPQE